MKYKNVHIPQYFPRISVNVLATLLAACVLLLPTGCSQSNPGDGAASNSMKSQAEGPVATQVADATPGFEPQHPAVRYDDPRQSVNDFLIAVKSGEEKVATSLLTTGAQKEAWTNGLAISGEGFPDAQFEISEVEYINENTEAHVMSTWADKTPYGEDKEFQCVWLLRQEAHGWCIYGMATKFLPTVQPIVLNFENQAEMQRRQQWAEQQIRQQRELELHQQQALTQGPPKPGQPTPAERQPVQQAAAPTTIR